jgi:hypothetical protein
MAAPPAPAASAEAPPERQPASDRSATALVVLGIVVAALFLYSMLAATEAHFTPQVVDLYLVLQYARAMAEGHPFQYNAGEPPSTGATSLLHTVVLAGAHAAGVRGEGLVAFAVLLGAAFYVWAILLARRVGTLLAGPREGLLAGALVALGGPVVWGFLYGSDVALFMVLALWLFERTLAAWPAASAGPLTAGTLLALARPEGLPIAVSLGAAWTRYAKPGVRGRLLPWLPAAAGLAVLGLNRVLTGQWLGTSVADKSLLENYGPGQTLALVSEYVVDVTRGLLLGFYPSQAPIGFARGWAPYHFPPLTLVFVLFAAAAAPSPVRTPLRWWLATVGAVFLASGNVFMGVHFNRYLMWAFPALLAVAAAGLGLATRRLAGEDVRLETALFRTAAGLALFLGVFSTVRFAVHYGDMAGEVYRRDVATARWIARNLPPGATIANLATSVEYLTGHRAVNLHGVTSPAFFGNRTAEREAGTFEALGRLPAEERPAYLVTSAAMQEGSVAYRGLVVEPALFASGSAPDDLLVYGMRYDLVGKNGRLYLPATLEAVRGLTEVGRLNVCDSRDERAHRYRFRSLSGGRRLHGAPRIGSYGAGGETEMVIDAGRAILGEESFRVRCDPAKELVLVMRTAADASANVRGTEGTGRRTIEFPQAGLILEVNGTPVARSTFQPSEGWEELVLRVPAAALTGPEAAIRVSGRYASFHYWFFQ